MKPVSPYHVPTATAARPRSHNPFYRVWATYPINILVCAHPQVPQWGMPLAGFSVIFFVKLRLHVLVQLLNEYGIHGHRINSNDEWIIYVMHYFNFNDYIAIVMRYYYINCPDYVFHAVSFGKLMYCAIALLVPIALFSWPLWPADRREIWQPSSLTCWGGFLLWCVPAYWQNDTTTTE